MTSLCCFRPGWGCICLSDAKKFMSLSIPLDCLVNGSHPAARHRSVVACCLLLIFFANFSVADLMARSNGIAPLDHPNIILMMGDDHGWEETGFHGHPYVKTPVLDDMAASGLRLDRFYAAHPNCSPTRASFLTGRHPNRMGTFAPGWSFRPEEITIAQVLSSVGYHCGHFGKWHVGPVKSDSPTSPGAMGFHEWLSHDNFFELNPTLSRNGAAPQMIRGESSEILIDEVLRFVERANRQHKPFFGVVWFGSPHEPYSGLAADLALYDDLPTKLSERKVSVTSNETGKQTSRPQGEVLRERYAEITAMDRSIGLLRTSLKDKGLRDNTLLFYCGDNGTSGDSALGFPHRGHKGQFYDGGTLVPGLIEWPAKIKQPRTSNFRACTSDLFPTLCALVNAPLPNRPLDGISLSPVLDNLVQRRNTPICFWEFDTKSLMESQPAPWIAPKLQEGTTPLAKLMGGKATRDFTNFRLDRVTEAEFAGTRSIIDGRYKLILQEGKNKNRKCELFDLENDSAENTDIIQRNPEIEKELQTKLRHWQESVLSSLLGADYGK
jgi:arylsulfatase A-like enzyme